MSLLVTGGASGIGAAVVATARARGEMVHVLDVTTGVDAADPVAVGEFVDAIGTPRRVAHLAGVVSAGGIAQTTLAEWDRTLRNNLTAAFVVSRPWCPGWRRPAAGRWC